MKIDLKIFIKYYLCFLIAHLTSNFIFDDGITESYSILDLLVYSFLYVIGSILCTSIEQKDLILQRNNRKSH